MRPTWPPQAPCRTRHTRPVHAHPLLTTSRAGEASEVRPAMGGLRISCSFTLGALFSRSSTSNALVSAMGVVVGGWAGDGHWSG